MRRQRRHHRDAYGHIALNGAGSAYDITLFGPEGVTRITVTRRGEIDLDSGGEVTNSVRKVAAYYLDAIGNHKLASSLNVSK